VLDKKVYCNTDVALQYLCGMALLAVMGVGVPPQQAACRSTATYKKHDSLPATI
jgi:hypothetical protein